MPKAGGRGKTRGATRGGAAKERAGRSVSEEITALANTLRELAAIRSTAEDAACRILDSAEGLLAFADKDEAKKAQDAILSIMTACGFHDLVGQRVTKITETLDRVIAKRLSGDASAQSRAGVARKSGTKGPKASGPALAVETHPQALIDVLFKPN